MDDSVNQESAGISQSRLKAWRLFIASFTCALFPETRLFRFKVVLYRWAGAVIGNNVRICSSVRILGVGPIFIGDDVWIGPETMIVATAAVRLGSNIDIAPRVYIGTGTHELDPVGRHTAGLGKSFPITIADGVWIGAGAIVAPDIRVGEKSMVAAGAVVVKNIPPHVVVGGVPARVLRNLES